MTQLERQAVLKAEHSSLLPTASPPMGDQEPEGGGAAFPLPFGSLSLPCPQPGQGPAYFVQPQHQGAEEREEQEPRVRAFSSSGCVVSGGTRVPVVHPLHSPGKQSSVWGLASPARSLLPSISAHWASESVPGPEQAREGGGPRETHGIRLPSARSLPPWVHGPFLRPAWDMPVTFTRGVTYGCVVRGLPRRTQKHPLKV